MLDKQDFLFIKISGKNFSFRHMLEFPCTLFRACLCSRIFLRSYISLIHAGNQAQYYISYLSLYMDDVLYALHLQLSSLLNCSHFHLLVLGIFNIFLPRLAYNMYFTHSIQHGWIWGASTRRGHSCTFTRSIGKPPRKDFSLSLKLEASST